MENDVSFRPLHNRLLGLQAVMLQADAIAKLPSSFGGQEEESGEEAFMGMIDVT